MKEQGAGIGGKYSPKAKMKVSPDGSQQWVRGEDVTARANTIAAHVKNYKVGSGPYDKNGVSPLNRLTDAATENYRKK